MTGARERDDGALRLADGTTGVAVEAGQMALARLKEREEVLQICYWFQGEGLGDVFTPQAVLPFLTSDAALVAEMFERLVEEGALVRRERGYGFAAEGKRKAARMFVETFTEFQQPGHGECQDGCCDGDEPCAQAHDPATCNDPRHRLRYIPSVKSG